MISVVPYFQVHQPFRLRRMRAFDVGRGRAPRWFDDAENARILRRVASRCYVPAADVLLASIERTKGRFRCAFSISGTALDQMERWAPRALERFRRLAATGAVEFLAETSHHSLEGLAPGREFERQVRAHAARIEATFGRRPTTLRNTELILSGAIAKRAAAMGFDCLLGEGAAPLLRGASPHRVHRVRGAPGIRLLVRSYDLSDDVGFRFGARDWSEWPLTPEKHCSWIARAPGGPDGVVGLFLDYETFGEHQPAATGIFRFLSEFPEAAFSAGLSFATPSEAAAAHAPDRTLSIPRPVSWADAERDVSAWLGNDLQREAARVHRDLRSVVVRGGVPEHLESWRRLSTSDHLYYMATKWDSDGDVHRYFSPWRSPHDAFVNYLHVLADLESRARAAARLRRPSLLPGQSTP